MNIRRIIVGNLGTNCYLLWLNDREDCVIIDPGAEPEMLRLAVAGLKRQLAGILLTHGHFDHVTGVKGLADPETPVYLCGADEGLPLWLTGGKLRHTAHYGDTVTLAGIEFQVLSTPGHTPGSVCLLTKDYLFSGDTLFAGACGRTDLPGGNRSQMERSLRTLYAIPGDRTVCPGHGDATTLELERQENPYMKKCAYGTEA